MGLVQHGFLHAFNALVGWAGAQLFRATARMAPWASTIKRCKSLVIALSNSLNYSANACFVPPHKGKRWRPQRGLWYPCQGASAWAVWTLRYAVHEASKASSSTSAEYGTRSGEAPVATPSLRSCVYLLASMMS